MVARVRVPRLKNPAVQIRLAQGRREIERANALVLDSYVDVGLWKDGEQFSKSKYHHSQARIACVAVDRDQVIGTVSIILDDAAIGLPADTFQPEIMRRLRTDGDRLGEVTAVAIDRNHAQDRALILYLYKFLYQYSFYYLGVDRFVATTTPKHAKFYEDVCGFQQLSKATDYYYVDLGVQLLTVHLLQDRIAMAQCYGVVHERISASPRSFYHFLLTDEHPNLHFPDRSEAKRSRNVDWLNEARTRSLPIAV